MFFEVCSLLGRKLTTFRSICYWFLEGWY